jgi:hypothetical protein
MVYFDNYCLDLLRFRLIPWYEIFTLDRQEMYGRIQSRGPGLCRSDVPM